MTLALTTPAFSQVPAEWRDSLVFHTFSIAAIDARTQGTPFPTHGTRVVTATPTSPVRASIAAIENV